MRYRLSACRSPSAAPCGRYTLSPALLEKSGYMTVQTLAGESNFSPDQNACNLITMTDSRR
jgi:hypothetical protein